MAENTWLALARRHGDRQRWNQYCREYQQESRRAARVGLTLAQYAAHPGAYLACCGLWQAITTLPHVCRTWGRRYLVAETGE